MPIGSLLIRQAVRMAASGAVEGAEIGRSASRLAVSLFLLAGLLPGLYAARRLPVGLWGLASGWSLIVGAALGATWLVRWRWSESPATRSTFRRVLRRCLAIVGGVGLVSMVLLNLSSVDARRGWLPSGGSITAVALVLQAAITAWVFRHSMQATSDIPVRAARAMTVAVVAAALMALLGGSAPGPLLVLLLVVAAIRLAVLPLRAGDGTSGGHRFASQVVLYIWTVAVVGVETGSSTREGGFVLVTFALVLGVAALIVLTRDTTLGTRVAIATPAIIAGAVMVGALAVLVPGEQSAIWLHQWHFRPPATLTPTGEKYEHGELARWYDTTLSAAEAQRAVHDGFSSLVSEWAGPDRFAINGHVWGYRLDVRIWDLRSMDGGRAALPRGALCRTETGICVLVLLRRSDDLDDGPSRPLRLSAAQLASAPTRSA